MEYSNKELNEIREAGYNHGYSVGYNEAAEDAYDSILNAIDWLREENCEQYCAIDDSIRLTIDELKENNTISKRVIGYDDYGKPLHERDFCTFDVNVTDWENKYIPDNVKVKALAHGLFKAAQFEGQVTYNEQDKCFELSIDNDYCPALYFHAIEPGTLRVKESNEQVKEHPLKRANKEIER